MKKKKKKKKKNRKKKIRKNNNIMWPNGIRKNIFCNKIL